MAENKTKKIKRETVFEKITRLKKEYPFPYDQIIGQYENDKMFRKVKKRKYNPNL
tara:strand:- start:17685 stop:17849 length:165 start_codon:yes stop_codon:yes gene_type:complete